MSSATAGWHDIKKLPIKDFNYVIIHTGITHLRNAHTNWQRNTKNPCTTWVFYYHLLQWIWSAVQWSVFTGNVKRLLVIHSPPSSDFWQTCWEPTLSDNTMKPWKYRVASSSLLGNITSIYPACSNWERSQDKWLWVERSQRGTDQSFAEQRSVVCKIQ